MRGRAVAWVALTLATALTVPAAGAQAGRVDILLPSRSDLATVPPSVRTTNVLVSGRTAELMRNGFPARLHYKLERWSAGTFVNDVKATAEWEVIVQYEPLPRRYRIVRATQQDAVVVGEYDGVPEADAVLAEPYAAPIQPPRRGSKSYYALTLDVQTMSLSDLDEVQRWLRGELRPAVRGRRNPGKAVTSGVRTLMVRILGGERVQYQATTRVFRP